MPGTAGTKISLAIEYGTGLAACPCFWLCLVLCSSTHTTLASSAVWPPQTKQGSELAGSLMVSQRSRPHTLAVAVAVMIEQLSSQRCAGIVRSIDRANGLPARTWTEYSVQGPVKPEFRHRRR